MLLLTSTTHSLELVTGSAVSTDFTVSFVDITTTTFTPGSSDGNVATATTTSLVMAPPASTQRQIKYMSIRNAGGGANVVTVQKDISGVNRTIFSASLAAGDELQYTDGDGFKILTAAGEVKVTVGAGGGGGATSMGMFATGNTTQSTTGSAALSSHMFAASGPLSVGITGGSVLYSAANQSNQQETMFATGNTTQSTTGTRNASSMIYAASGPLSVGITGGSVLYSAPNQTNQQITMFATGNTTQSSTGTVNASSHIFAASGGLSVGITGGTVLYSAGAFFTKSRFNPFMEAAGLASQIGSNTLQFHPVPDPDNFQFDRMLFDMTVAQTGTSGSGGLTISMWAGIYTRNVSTLSLLASQSTSQGFTVSSTNSTIHNGAKIFSMGWTSTITQNDIWIGIVSRTTTSGTNQFGGISNYVASDVTENFSGLMGVAQNATNQNVLGLGVYTATTTGIPSSVAFSQINGTNGLLNRVPLYYFLSQTA